MRVFPAVLCLLCGFCFSLAAPAASAQTPGADRIATLFGGMSSDDIQDIAVAADGSVYVVGTTESADFPATNGAFDTALNGTSDAFVAHFDTDLTVLLAATYIGGEDDGFGGTDTRDEGYGIVVSDEAAFIVGGSDAVDFPVIDGAIQSVNNSGPGYSDAFVARLSLDLSTLEAATYLGATDEDIAFDVALDPQGDVVFTGITDGANFPLSPGAYSPNSGPVEGPFVTRLSPDLTELRASTRLNGSGSANALAIDPISGDVAIVGTTSDQNYPATPNAYDTTCGTDGDCNFINPFNPLFDDAFVSRVSRDGTTLVASTYLGGEDFDYGTAIAWADGDIVIAGETESQVFPVSSDAFQTDHDDGITTGYMARLDPMLTTLSRSTFFGGTVSQTSGIILDMYVDPGTGNVHTVGRTRANDLPVTSNAFDQGFTGEFEQFYSVFDPTLSDLVFSSFLGGTDPDVLDGPFPAANAIAVGDDGSLYVVGTARATDFFTSEDAYQLDLAGSADGFVTRLVDGNPVANESDGAQPDATTLLPGYPNPFASAATLRFQLAETSVVRLSVYDVQGREIAVLVDRSLPAGTHEAQLSARDLASGTYFVRLTAGDVTQTQPVSLVR